MVVKKGKIFHSYMIIKKMKDFPEAKEKSIFTVLNSIQINQSGQIHLIFVSSCSPKGFKELPHTIFPFLFLTGFSHQPNTNTNPHLPQKLNKQYEIPAKTEHPHQK